MIDDDDIWENVGFIRASKHREPILRTLQSEQPLRPSEIASQTKMGTRTVSTYLSGERGLSNMGFVECLNETVKKGRLYHLTDQGEEVLSALDKIDRD